MFLALISVICCIWSLVSPAVSSMAHAPPSPVNALCCWCPADVSLECIYQSFFKGKIFFFLGFSDATSHSMFVAYRLLRLQEKMFLALAILNVYKTLIQPQNLTLSKQFLPGSKWWVPGRAHPKQECGKDRLQAQFYLGQGLRKTDVYVALMFGVSPPHQDSQWQPVISLQCGAPLVSDWPSVRTSCAPPLLEGSAQVWRKYGEGEMQGLGEHQW